MKKYKVQIEPEQSSRIISFEDALNYIKHHSYGRVARQIWRRDCYIVLFSPIAHGGEMLTVDGHAALPHKASIMLKNEEGCWEEWNPSNTDLLSDDWEIVK